MRYILTCGRCGYEIGGNIGVGFSFPSVYMETMKAARAGVLGKNIKEFLEEYPDGVLNVEKTFLQCGDCGSLIIGQNLSMYTRVSNAPEKEYGRWSAAFPYEEEKYVVPWQLKEEEGYGNSRRFPRVTVPGTLLYCETG